MNNRRKFLQTLGLSVSAALAAQPAWSRNLHTAIKEAEAFLPEQLADDEKFWRAIQKSFINKSGIINLNNGGVSPAPKMVAEAMEDNYEFCNHIPSNNMWRELDKGREPLRIKLAKMAGCSEEEIAMNRNATEGLETIIFGLPLKKEDEVVAAKQDYPHPVFAWKQREQRDGIKVKWVNLQLPSEDENYLVNAFVNEFTSKTKLVHLTHIINWNGQILPIKKIAGEARKRGIEVMVDGAHSFSHFKFSLSDLNIDYFATSLHKWLYAPIGAGMLYVKKDKIKNLYPLFAGGDPFKDDIRKFEHLGTRPFYIEQAIHKAIEFNEMIGIERKQERLYYLKNYWMEKIRHFPGIKINTPISAAWSCAIGNFSIEGKKAIDIVDFLQEKYHIHTVNINWENIHGVRVTPNVYTKLNDLDLLVQGIKEFSEG